MDRQGIYVLKYGHKSRREKRREVNLSYNIKIQQQIRQGSSS